MSNNKEENKSNEEQNKNAIVKPEPETLHTTDPQEHMEGPISSIVQAVKEKADENDDVEKDNHHENE